MVGSTAFAEDKVKRPLEQILNYKLASISLNMSQQTMQDTLRKQGFNKVSYGGSKDATRGWVFQRNELTINIEFSKGAVNKIQLTDRAKRGELEFTNYLKHVRKRWLLADDEYFCRQSVCKIYHRQGYYQLHAVAALPITEEVVITY